MKPIYVHYFSLSAPSSHKTSLNGSNTIPMPRHIARHSRPTATAHRIGKSDPRGHKIMPFLCVPRWTLDLYTFYMTCKLEFDISIITEPVYYYRLVYSI